MVFWDGLNTHQCSYVTLTDRRVGGWLSRFKLIGLRRISLATSPRYGQMGLRWLSRFKLIRLRRMSLSTSPRYGWMGLRWLSRFKLIRLRRISLATFADGWAEGWAEVWV